MARTQTAKQKKTAPARGNPFEPRTTEESARAAEREVHVIRPGVICDTETRGFATPRDRPPTEIVVDASEGFVPLWAKGVTIRWRFRERSMRYFKNPGAAKKAIRGLLGAALMRWGDAAPVRFAERDDLWDFEVVMREADSCTAQGCVLASAFFPDAGRHELEIYPKLFTQSREEQLETLIHEIGHVFGLRHFFANVTEKRWRSEIFGTHQPFTIMNYGSQSVLTDDDRSDLKRLYQLVWSGDLKDVNGTPVRLVRPFSTLAANPVENVAAVGSVQLLASG